MDEGLGVQAAGEFEIECTHRTPTSQPDPNRQPRPALIRFLWQSAREKIVDVTREKCSFEWEGCRVSLFPDMTGELAKKRKLSPPWSESCPSSVLNTQWPTPLPYESSGKKIISVPTWQQQLRSFWRTSGKLMTDVFTDEPCWRMDSRRGLVLD